MKKVVTLLLALMLSATALTACSSKNDTKDPSGENPTQDEQNTADAEPELSEIFDAVKDAYGENYIPSAPIEEDIFTSVYEMNMDNIEEYYAEEPMVSVNVDRFFAIKAKEGKGDALEADVNAYHEKLVNDTMQYPMNLPRIAASQVVRHGNYVFFVMLSGFPENETEMTEEDLAKYSEEQTQIGVDVIDGFFK